MKRTMSGRCENSVLIVGSLANDEIKQRIENILARYVPDGDPATLCDRLIQENKTISDHLLKIFHGDPTSRDQCRVLLDQLRYRVVAHQSIDNPELTNQTQPDGASTGADSFSGSQQELIWSQNASKISLKKILKIAFAMIGVALLLSAICVIIYKYTSNGNRRYESDPVYLQTFRTKATEEEKKEIRGLTILNKEMFVVSDWSSKVEVYDSIKFSFSRQLDLVRFGLSRAQDIVSCSRNKCLYIIDYKGNGLTNQILRVDPYGNLVKKWSVGSDFGRLSVTAESNVLFTVDDKNKLSEYSPDGNLIRDVNISPDAGIRHPRHAVKLTNGHFVLSHGFYTDDLNRVCILDADGKLTKSFGGKRGSAIGQLDDPIYLVVDGYGFLFVADRYNGRVLLLDLDLKFKREILSKDQHGLRRPYRILLDEGRLFVADNELDNQRIVIFHFE